MSSITVMVFIRSKIPVYPNCQTGELQNPQQSEFPIISNVTCISVLHFSLLTATPDQYNLSREQPAFPQLNAAIAARNSQNSKTARDLRKHHFPIKPVVFYNENTL